jgi:hypothetical protein
MRSPQVIYQYCLLIFGETRRSIGITQRQGALPPPGTRALVDEIRPQVERMIKEGQLLPVAGHFSEEPAS